MATIFSAPQIGDPRATGIKNGGIKAFESDIVYPVSRLTTPDGTWSGSKQLEFRWRSDSSRFWSPRDTKLYVKYKVGFGQSMNVLNTQLVTLAAATTVAIPAGTRCIQDNVAGTTASNVNIGATTFTLDVSKGTFLGTNPITVHLAAGDQQFAPTDITSIGALTEPTEPMDLSKAADVDTVRNVRITAAPNTSLFDGGVRYLQNSRTK
jgi:hypothetical protein